MRHMGPLQDCKGDMMDKPKRVQAKYEGLTHDGKTWRDADGNPVATTWWTSLRPAARLAIGLTAGAVILAFSVVFTLAYM